MPLILHIETSGSYCSVALSRGFEIVGYKISEERLTHNATLAPYIHDVIQLSGHAVTDLDAVSVSAGPGSYTGLRVGASLAKALCYSRDIPLIAVSTLESLALEAIRRSDGGEARYYANVDARRMEVYMAAFDALGKRFTEDQACIITPDTFTEELDKGHRVVFCGTGAQKVKELLTNDQIELLPLEVSAEFLVAPAIRAYERAEFVELAEFEPIYIKPPNITVPSRVIL